MIARESGRGKSMERPQLLEDLRSWLAAARFPSGRLPPERELAARLGVGRAAVRKSLMILESEGWLRREVGRGTFLTPKANDGLKLDGASVASRTSPVQAMEARLILEPEVARRAAMTATAEQVLSMRALNSQMRSVGSWAQYEDLDWQFHDLLAEATSNVLLIEMQRLVNGVRRAVVWGRLSLRPSGPDPTYHSFAEHDAIIDAIANRDRNAAAGAMRKHLESTAATIW
jgi:DNA-binding FadR family transcriptional regulator